MTFSTLHHDEYLDDFQVSRPWQNRITERSFNQKNSWQQYTKCGSRSSIPPMNDVKGFLYNSRIAVYYDEYIYHRERERARARKSTLIYSYVILNTVHNHSTSHAVIPSHVTHTHTRVHTRECDAVFSAMVLRVLLEGRLTVKLCVPPYSFAVTRHAIYINNVESDLLTPLPFWIRDP